MLKRLSYILPIAIVLLLVSGAAMAQTPPPSAPPSDGAPIDGFVGLLLISGISYGARKIRQRGIIGE